MKESFHVIPLHSFDQIDFGWSREKVLNTLGPPDSVLGKPEWYFYKGVDFSLYYGDKDFVEYIEIANPKNQSKSIVLTIDNFRIDIFNTPASSLIDSIEKSTAEKHDIDCSEVPYSFVFLKYELSLWRPTIPENPDDEDGKYFESLGIGVKGYFSEMS